MYLSIEVTDFQNFNPSDCVFQYEIEQYKADKKDELISLEQYLLKDGNSLDGDKIQQKLFPETNADIFLSHSHGDENEVIKLAILLERKGFTVFIDSCVWGNAFTLLKTIDKKYCRDDGSTTYDYNRRNHSTSHVYMMLNTALHRMIDKCEIFLFLGTPKSTSVKEGIKNQESLKSPWILSELAFTQHVRRISSLPKYLAESLETRSIGMDSMPPVNIHYKKPKLDYKIDSLRLNNFLNSDVDDRDSAYRKLYRSLK